MVSIHFITPFLFVSLSGGTVSGDRAYCLSCIPFFYYAQLLIVFYAHHFSIVLPFCVT